MQLNLRPINFMMLGCLLLFAACKQQKPSHKPAQKPGSRVEKMAHETIRKAAPDHSISHTDTVEIKGMKFHPAKIKVQKGDTLVFINKGFVDHDVTQIDKKWQSPRLKPGDRYKRIAQKSTKYYCSIHVVMKGEIVVN